MWELFIEEWKETRNKHKNHMDAMETNNRYVDFVNEDRFDEMEELSKSLFGAEEYDELVDKIASFFEKEENWRALKNCWIENDRSDDLRKLLARALKE